MLTDIYIKNSLLPKPNKEYKVHDGGGLYLVVKPTGRKVWRKRYYFRGKDRTYTIGHYPDVSLKEAREERKRVSILVKSGIDPSLEKKRVQHKGKGFKDIATEWWELKSGIQHSDLIEHKYKLKKIEALVDPNLDVWNTKHAIKIWRRLEKYVFPDLAPHAIQDLKTQDIKRVIEKVIRFKHKDIPKRVLQYLRAIFNHALLQNIIEYNPCLGVEAVIPKYKVQHRRSVPIEEIGDFLKAINGYEDKVVRCGLKLVVLTLLRNTELRGAKWVEIDFKSKRWCVPAERMKMNSYHIVPITKQMEKILRQLRKLTGDSDYLFPSDISESGIRNENTFSDAIDELGFKSVIQPHGLRSTAKSAIANAGFNDLASEKQLSHADSNDVRAAYIHLADFMGERVEMMQWYSDEIEDKGMKIP